MKVAKDFSVEDIHLLEPIIDECVFDWATCDNLSGHVVTKALLGNPELFPVPPSERVTTRLFRGGNLLLLGGSASLAFPFSISPEEDNRRNESSTFVSRKDLPLFLISVVKNPYRFTQLGAGWVLRDVSVHHKDIVIDFLNRHKDDMIKEAVRYATEKMSPSDKKKVEALKRVPKDSFPVSSQLCDSSNPSRLHPTND